MGAVHKSAIVRSAVLALELSDSHPPEEESGCAGAEWTLAQMLALFLRAGYNTGEGGRRGVSRALAALPSHRPAVSEGGGGGAGSQPASQPPPSRLLLPADRLVTPPGGCCSHRGAPAGHSVDHGILLQRLALALHQLPQRLPAPPGGVRRPGAPKGERRGAVDASRAHPRTYPCCPPSLIHTPTYPPHPHTHPPTPPAHTRRAW